MEEKFIIRSVNAKNMITKGVIAGHDFGLKADMRRDVTDVSR